MDLRENLRRHTDNNINFSGPISIPRDQESEAIRNAPAYNTEEARSLVRVMPEIRALVDRIPDDDELTCIGAAVPSPEALQQLENELKQITGDHHKVSLLMVDVKTRSGVSFHSRVPMCSQSTIKAIYVGALINSQPGSLTENGQYMHDAVVFSNNDAYASLRSIYGREPIRKWCEETGVSTALSEPNYPRNGTAMDMFKLWTRLYCFLNDGSDSANFGVYYADSLASATRERLGSRYPVQTKAGWEIGLDEDQYYDPNMRIPAAFTDGDPSNDECAINDTGVVYTENGPYLFVIYSDFPFGIFRNYTIPNPLYGLVDAVLAVQKSFYQ